MCNINIIDLFAGPGGWDTGLAMLGRQDVLGFEWDTSACETARAAGHLRMQADIARLDASKYAPGHEGLIASPPCQGFSMAGRGRGRADVPRILAAVNDISVGIDPDTALGWLRGECEDPRSVLVLEPLRWALAGDFRWLAWEQVTPVLPLWEACAAVLTLRGYSVWTGILNAEQYGVPQTRRRAVLMASLDGDVVPPTPTHSRYYPRDPGRLDPGVLPWVSMATALGWDVAGDVALRSNYGTGGDPQARGIRPACGPAATITSKVDRNKWVYRASNQAHAARRPLDHPAPTVKFGERSNKVEWMPVADAPAPHKSGVRVTVEQAAVLQSFPADYPWHGTKSERYRQVGDAVPPLLAAHILSALGVGG